MSRTKSTRSPEPATLKTTPISEKQLAANRANAARSTGPRTPEGKARSSRNALKHGFTGSHFTIVRVEDMREVERLKADAVACYQPVNSQEMVAVERIALAQQMMFRASRLEAGLFTAAVDDALDRSGRPIRPMSLDMVDGDVAVTRAQNRNYAMAEGFRRMARESNGAVWTLFLRYHAHAERMFRRAVEDFERLKKLRKDLPNEPIWQNQPEEKPELATLDDLNIPVPDDYRYNPTIALDADLHTPPPPSPENPTLLTPGS